MRQRLKIEERQRLKLRIERGKEGREGGGGKSKRGVKAKTLCQVPGRQAGATVVGRTTLLTGKPLQRPLYEVTK